MPPIKFDIFFDEIIAVIILLSIFCVLSGLVIYILFLSIHQNQIELETLNYLVFFYKKIKLK